MIKGALGAHTGATNRRLRVLVGQRAGEQHFGDPNLYLAKWFTLAMNGWSCVVSENGRTNLVPME
jgi:hypothetical protein